MPNVVILRNARVRRFCRVFTLVTYNVKIDGKEIVTRRRWFFLDRPINKRK